MKFPNSYYTHSSVVNVLTSWKIPVAFQEQNSPGMSQIPRNVNSLTFWIFRFLLHTFIHSNLSHFLEKFWSRFRNKIFPKSQKWDSEPSRPPVAQVGARAGPPISLSGGGVFISKRPGCLRGPEAPRPRRQIFSKCQIPELRFWSRFTTEIS